MTEAEEYLKEKNIIHSGILLQSAFDPSKRGNVNLYRVDELMQSYAEEHLKKKVGEFTDKVINDKYPIGGDYPKEYNRCKHQKRESAK